MKRVCFLGQLFYFKCSIPDTLTDCNVEAFNFDFTNTVIKNPDADIWFIFRPEIMPTELLTRLKGKKVWISTEPIERKDGQDIRPLYERLLAGYNRFDLVVHYDKNHLSALKRMGIVAQEFELPVNLNVFKEIEISKKYEVMFLGRSTSHREDILAGLKRDKDVLHIAHGFTDSEKVLLMNQTHINLNIHIERSFKQQQHRVQNMLATGAFVMTEPLSHHDKIIPGEHVEIIHNRQDLDHKVDFYLKHPEKTQRFRDNGIKLARTRFDSQNEWFKLIKQLS